MILPGRDVPLKAFVRDLYDRIVRDNLADYAASVAYSAILSIFPFLLFVVALAALIVDPATVEGIVDQIRRVAPPQAAGILVDRLHTLASGPKTTLATVSAIGVVWTASGAIAALTTAFNIAYDVRETRPYWKTRGMAIVVTLAGAVFVIAASALAVVAPVLANSLGRPIAGVVLWMRWPVAAILMLSVVAYLYHLLPNTQQRFELVSLGSVTAVLGWVLASLCFSEYVGHFGRYEVVYGAVGSLIVLLLWLWLSALVVLVGAEINAVLQRLACGTEGLPRCSPVPEGEGEKITKEAQGPAR